MFIAGILLGLSIVILALWRRWLTVSGAAAALFVGGLTLVFGGWPFVLPLLFFFTTASLLSKLQNEPKRRAARRFDKSHERDAMQVLANGGLGALAALAYGLTNTTVWFACFLGVMATVAADTWATEVGTLSKSRPRSILTGKAVAPGMSGGVSALGLAASLVAGTFTGAAGALTGAWPTTAPMVLGSIAGLAGSLADSLLGATLQRHYWDPDRKELTERAHVNGKPLELRRGIRWINNDVVNIIAAAFGGLIGVVLWMLI